MYKYQKIIAFLATIGWLVFIFAAFSGFHFWYGGFAIFLWLALGAINYRHDTSLWLLKNRFKNFFTFYVFLVIFSVYADLIIGQMIAHLWYYPHYALLEDWVRLYIILYPFAGLAVLELTYFLVGLFNERLVIHLKVESFFHKIIDKLDIILLSLIVFLPVIQLVSSVELRKPLVYMSILWILVTTIKFKYHIKHWLHFFVIFVATLLISVFLHEIPNVGVFEWKYNKAPILNHEFLGVPLWVIIGWYVLVVLMLRFWMFFVLKKRKEIDKV